MVQIATPVSDMFVDRDMAARITALSDVLEGRDHMHDVELGRQGLFHFELSIVNVWSSEDRARVKRIIDQREALELISFHVASCCSHPVADGVMFREGGVIFSKMDMFENAAENITWLKKITVSRGIRIAVENNNYYPTPAYAHVTASDFITHVVVDNDIGFLFDLSHARIAAINKGVPYEEYCDGLPMDRALQVHVSQWGIDAKGMAFDAHEVPEPSLNAEVVALVKKYGITYVTIEYYRDREKLLEILKVYRGLLGKGNI